LAPKARERVVGKLEIASFHAAQHLDLVEVARAKPSTTYSGQPLKVAAA